MRDGKVRSDEPAGSPSFRGAQKQQTSVWLEVFVCLLACLLACLFLNWSIAQRAQNKVFFCRDKFNIL